MYHKDNFLSQLKLLEHQADSLQLEITGLKELVIMAMGSLEDRVFELECWTNPSSDCGEPLCNSYED